MPSASVRTAIKVKPGFFNNIRAPNRKSSNISPSDLYSCRSFRRAVQSIHDYSLQVFGAALRTLSDQMLDHAAFAREDKHLRNRRRAGFILGPFQEGRRQPPIVVPDGVIGAGSLENLDDVAL